MRSSHQPGLAIAADHSRLYSSTVRGAVMILGRNQHRLVSTWSFFALYSWKSVGPRGTTAQKGTSSSSYAECSGYVPFIGDSVCDELNNNAGCGERERELPRYRSQRGRTFAFHSQHGTK